jgi:hypothetical protein
VFPGRIGGGKQTWIRAVPQSREDYVPHAVPPLFITNTVIRNVRVQNVLDILKLEVRDPITRWADCGGTSSSGMGRMAEDAVAAVAVLKTAVAFIGSMMSLEVFPVQETVSILSCINLKLNIPELYRRVQNWFFAAWRSLSLGIDNVEGASKWSRGILAVHPA